MIDALTAFTIHMNASNLTWNVLLTRLQLL